MLQKFYNSRVDVNTMRLAKRVFGLFLGVGLVIMALNILTGLVRMGVL